MNNEVVNSISLPLIIIDVIMKGNILKIERIIFFIGHFALYITLVIYIVTINVDILPAINASAVPIIGFKNITNGYKLQMDIIAPVATTGKSKFIFILAIPNV
jgi:hypothetical protein